LPVIRQLTSGIAQSRSTRLAVTYLDRDTEAFGQDELAEEFVSSNQASAINCSFL